MAKRKLTAEEKREKILELFHETSDVFQLKELERLAPKEKGIVQQSVKLTLQELVDNGQVRSEKIAGSIYYWAFPSDALANTREQLTQAETDVKLYEKKIEQLKQQIATAKAAASNAAELEHIVNEIEELKKEKQELEAREGAAMSNGDVDYVTVIAKGKDTSQIQEAANRWTNNIFSIKSWCKRKFNKEDRELNKAFGIPDDLDYLED